MTGAGAGMSGLIGDCRYAIRLLARTQLASAIAIGALAIAMGFVSSLLSLYVDIRLRPHSGYEDSGRLVTLGQGNGDALNYLTLGLIDLMAEEMTSIEAIAGSMPGRVLAAESGEQIAIEIVSRGFFDGLRPRLHAGRGFGPADHQRDAELVAVISWRYWQDVLGGEDVLGTTIEIEMQPTMILAGTQGDEAESEFPEFRIIGVLAPEVSGFVEDAAIWLPLERAVIYDVVGPADRLAEEIPRLSVKTLARRAEGASTDSVIAEMRARYTDLTGYFRISPSRQADAADGLVTNLGVLRESQRQLLVLLAASVLLALVAAANVSLFLLARAPGRRRELGIRMAVGAPLGRLGRQLATEAATLVAIAGGLGLAISIWVSQFLSGLAFLREARFNEVTLLDWRVLGGVAAFVLILALLVSLAPVLGLRRFGINAASRDSRARAAPVQRIAGTVQIAIAGTLGAAAIAFGWHMNAMIFGDPGFTIADRYTVALDMNLAGEMTQGYSEARSLGTVELGRHRERIEAIPGVFAATFSYPIPGVEYPFSTMLPRPDNPDVQVSVVSGSIDSSFVDAFGLRLRHGRAPTGNDVDVVLVNRAFAQAIWDRDNVVGENTPTSFLAPPSLPVIGVLEDVSFGHPLAEVDPMMFTVQAQTSTSLATIASSLTAAMLGQELRRIVALGDIEYRVGAVRPLAELRDQLIAPDRARGLLTIGAAGLVVLLAGFGFYGTQRYIVSAGRREYAIRASLGAGPKAIRSLVLGRAALFALPGLVAASLLAFIAAGWLRGDYVTREVSPGAVTAAVVLGLGALLIAASLGPALSAMRTQPTPLLRED